MPRMPNAANAQPRPRRGELRSLLALAFGAGGLFFLAGCIPKTDVGPVSDEARTLTHGQVQMRLVVGETTQAEVIEHFGAPNVTSRTGEGTERWTYQRAAQVRQSGVREGGWTILFAGQSGASAQAASSSRMITLIIDFDERGVVSDFRSRTSTF